MQSGFCFFKFLFKSKPDKSSQRVVDEIGVVSTCLNYTTQSRFPFPAFLQEEPIRGFRFCDHLPFMEELEQSYRGVVLTAMKDVGAAVE